MASKAVSWRRLEAARYLSMRYFQRLAEYARRV
jgi:hypothetical protein